MSSPFCGVLSESRRRQGVDSNSSFAELLDDFRDTLEQSRSEPEREYEMLFSLASHTTRSVCISQLVESERFFPVLCRRPMISEAYLPGIYRLPLHVEFFMLQQLVVASQ